MNRLRPACLLCILTASAVLSCSKKSDPTPLAAGVIGAGGGTLQVTAGSQAGTSINVPAGALSADMRISVFADRPTSERAKDIVGPAARFSPIGLQLAQDATFTIVFDPSTLPTGTVASDVAVTARAGNAGALTHITPTSVDLATGRVVFAADQLEDFWVTARTAFPIERYLVLGDGDSYEFDGDNAIQVALTSMEPNFNGRPIWRYKLQLPFFARTGLYLEPDTVTGAVRFLGQFDLPSGMPAVQEIPDTEFQLLRNLVRVGDQTVAAFTYTAYEVNLPNPPVQIYTGTGDITTTIVEEVAVDTPLGRFDPAILIEFESDFSDTRPQVGAGRTRLWLARDVGPVRIQSNDDPPQQVLRAIVGGRIISGS